MHLAVLCAILCPLSFSLELPGCEMYPYQSRQYLKTVSLVPLWEIIHTALVIDTFTESCAAEGDGQCHEPLPSLMSVLRTGGRGDTGFVISSCHFESHQDPYQQVFFFQTTEGILLSMAFPF